MKRFFLGLAATAAIGSLTLISTAQPPEGGRKAREEQPAREGQPPREGQGRPGGREGQPPREGQGRPGGREGQPGGPGGRPMHGGFEVGKVLPPMAAELLKLTDDQKTKIAAMEREVKEKLALILTAEQMKQLETVGPGRGGPGGPGGPGRGGPGGPGGRPGAEGGPGGRPEGGPGGRPEGGRPEGGRRPGGEGGERRPPVDE